MDRIDFLHYVTIAALLVWLGLVLFGAPDWSRALAALAAVAGVVGGRILIGRNR